MGEVGLAALSQFVCRAVPRWMPDSQIITATGLVDPRWAEEHRTACERVCRELGRALPLISSIHDMVHHGAAQSSADIAASVSRAATSKRKSGSDTSSAYTKLMDKASW